MAMRAMTSTSLMTRPSFWYRLDIPFVVMGLFFISMAVSEYLLPGSGEGERLAVKILNGLQAAFALIVVFLTPGSVTTRWLSISFSLLFFWLCFVGIIYTDNLLETLYLLGMYFNWYIMFLFFYIRSRTHPQQLQVFLVLAFCSLLFWVPALLKFTRISMDLGNLTMEHQRQNNAGYYVVALFPYALLLKRKTLKIIAVALISYGAIYSLKRGAVLALVLMGLSSSFLYFILSVHTKKWGKKSIAIVLIWVIAIAAGMLFLRANPEVIERRIESGFDDRQELYKVTIQNIEKANLYELVIGQGGGAAKRAVGMQPHNDWLLLLYDYGIVGVILMFNVYVGVVILLWKLFKLRSPLAVPLISTLILMTCVQIYSFGILLKTFGFITGSIGLILGCFYGEHRLRQIKP